MRVKWITPRPCGWAGDTQIGEVVRTEDERPGFGPAEAGHKGPACLIQFPNKCTVWVSPDECVEAL